jgi:uncharacterized protein YciI
LERGTDEKGEISLAVLGLATICGPRVMIAQTPAPAILAGAMGGDYWDKAALIIFEAATLEDAETMARNGPAVRRTLFKRKSGRLMCFG